MPLIRIEQTCSESCGRGVYKDGLCARCYNLFKSMGTLHQHTGEPKPERVYVDGEAIITEEECAELEAHFQL